MQAQGPSPLQNQYRPVEQTQNLVDHLVPPGPPLPLDDRYKHFKSETNSESIRLIHIFLN